MPGTTVLNYVIYDRDHHECLDLDASTLKVGPLVEAELRKDGHDVTVIPHPNGRYGELEVRGLRLDGMAAYGVVHDALMGLGDIWVMQEDECLDH